MAGASLNRVELIGRVGSDIEVRYTPSGEAVANFRFATTDTWKDKASGAKREQTEWHRIVVYRQLAEIAKQHVKKGQQLFLAGRIKTRKWQDKEGQDRYVTEIEVSDIQMLGGRSEGVTDNATDAPKPNGGGGESAPGRQRPGDYPLGDDLPYIEKSMMFDPMFVKATAAVRRTV